VTDLPNAAFEGAIAIEEPPTLERHARLRKFWFDDFRGVVTSPGSRASRWGIRAARTLASRACWTGWWKRSATFSTERGFAPVHGIASRHPSRMGGQRPDIDR
jgi:hypothetical protein